MSTDDTQAQAQAQVPREVTLNVHGALTRALNPPLHRRNMHRICWHRFYTHLAYISHDSKSNLTSSGL